MPVEVIRYTPEELLHLRESPLIQKPDGLPAIEQWMEPAPEQNQRKGGRTQGGRNDEAAQANENGQRPALFQPKHFTRHSSTAPEDIVLGPPKMAFASSSRVPKMADANDKEEDAAEARTTNIRDKFFKEREEQRKNGTLNGRRGREEGEGWTNVRGRKASFSEDPERPTRIGGRFTREADAEEPGPRRNGARGRFEQPWGRDSAETKDADGGHGSWRDRRDNRDREWARGGNNRIEEDPEWMDTPVKKKDDIGMGRFQRNNNKGLEWDDGSKDDKKAHTQEEFQRWKEQMKAGSAPVQEKENTPDPVPAKDTPTSSKPITPMVLDGKDMFGMWGAAVKQESPATTEGAPAPPKQRVPTKQSKFAKLFTPQEEQPQQLQPQPPPVQEPNFGALNGNSEDKEGFQRILQMLGSTNITTQSPSQGSAPSRKPSVFSPVETRSPDRDTVHVQPQPTRHHILRSREEKAGFIESVLAPRGTPTEFKGPHGAFGPFSPAGEPGQEQLRHEPRPEGGIRSPEERMPQPTPNNGLGNFGIQGLLSSQPPLHAAQLSRDREFLLNLMTQPQRNTPPQPSQSRPPPPPELFTNFMDTKAMPPRGNPPPGLFEDRQFPENDVRYQPQPRRIPENPEFENAARRATRFNLPIHLDDPAIAGLQRRNTADAGMPRGQMGNMGIPQQPPPEQMWNMKPPGLHQPQDRPPNMAPPPGFPAANNIGGRGPPGFGGPNNMPPFSASNTPLGHPGMNVQRGPPSNGPASAGPGPAPGMFSPPGHGGPPHGYFGPPPSGPPPPPGFGGPGPMGMGGPHHEQMQQMLNLRGGGPPPGMGAGPGGMGMGMPGQRGPGGMGQGPGPNGFDFFENQRRGSHVQGPFGL